MVFQRLKDYNLRLSPSKCRYLWRSVKFLGYIVSQEGVASDPLKVVAIVNILKERLDGTTPSVGKIRSFLDMVVYFQHFTENCSMIVRPFFSCCLARRDLGK